MCHFLYIASPLTLSEVRSMLPDGLTADALPVPEQDRLKAIHFDTATGAIVFRGPCSCDILRDRDPDARQDEAYHRQRYRQLGYNRSRMIRHLERHRQGGGPSRPRPPDYWGQAFNAFVIEHARNAGPTMYYRHFSHDGLADDLGLDHPIRRIAVDDIRGPVEHWLPESTPTIVV